MDSRKNNMPTGTASVQFNPANLGGALPPLLDPATLERCAALCEQSKVLILEDHAATATAWNSCARELVKGLAARGVAVEYARFHTTPGVVRGRNGTLYHWRELAKQREGVPLFIFSDSQGTYGARGARMLLELRAHPRLVWLELREARAWDAATVRVVQHDVPLYPASAPGIMAAFRYLLGNHGRLPDYRKNLPYWQALSSAVPQRGLAVQVSRLLGNAETWAQACAMLPPPLSLALAQRLRREFYPRLEEDCIGRLWALPGVRCEGRGLYLPARVLALLRSGFAVQDMHLQEAVLDFLEQCIRRAEPDPQNRRAHLAWRWYFARLQLERKPDAALAAIRALTAEPALKVDIRQEMKQRILPLKPGAGTGERVPLRLKPQTHQGLKTLLELSPDCGISYAQLHPLVYRTGFALDYARHLYRKPQLFGLFSPDGDYVLSLGADDQALLWHLPSDRMQALKAHDDFAATRLGIGLSAAKPVGLFYPDGKHVVTALYDNCVRIWETGSGEPVYVLRDHAICLRDLALDRDEQLLAVSADAQVWNLTKGRLLLHLPTHRHMLNSLAVSPDGTYLLSAGAEPAARLWDLHSGELLRVFDGHRGMLNSARFSPDGKLFATACSDGAIGLWSAADGRLLGRLRGHRKSVREVCFAPNGKWLLSASDDRTACLWRIRDGRLLQTLEEHRGAVTSAVFDARGERILTASNDGKLRVWQWEGAGI